MFGSLRNNTNLAPDAKAALFFTPLGRDLELIDRLGRAREIEAGHVIMTEGTPGDEAFIVINGTAIVSRGDEVIATVGRGDLVGEASLFTGEPRNATLVATSPLSLVAIDKREFRWLCFESRVVGNVARSLLAERAAR